MEYEGFRRIENDPIWLGDLVTENLRSPEDIGSGLSELFLECENNAWETRLLEGAVKALTGIQV